MINFHTPTGAAFQSPTLITTPSPPEVPNFPSPDGAIAQLVGEVFESAPAAERSRLLEHLLQPLSALSIVAVANGVFAEIRFRSGWQTLHVRLEDTQKIRVTDVIALVNHVQQVSVDSVNALARMLVASPVMAGSAAAALLVTVLLQRARSHRSSDIGSALDDLSFA